VKRKCASIFSRRWIEPPLAFSITNILRRSISLGLECERRCAEESEKSGAGNNRSVIGCERAKEEII
jgi:hypothetical protein